jgi:hypothetical protein
MYDERSPESGPLCTVPITVVKPEAIPPRCDTWHMETEALRASTDTAARRRLTLAPNERMRRFIVPPPGCQYVDCVIEDRRVFTDVAVTTTTTIPMVPMVAASDGGGGSGSGSGNRSNVIESTSGGPEAASDDADDDGDATAGAEGHDDATAGDFSVYGSDTVDGGHLDVSARTVVLHALQVFRGTPYRDHEKRAFVHLHAGSRHVISWPVTAGVTMELSLARFWSTIEDPMCALTVHFRGVDPSPERVLLHGGCRVSGMVRVANTLGAGIVEIHPSAKLEKWVAVVKPVAPGKVSTLGERDALMTDGPGRTADTPLYQLVLEYDVDLAEPAEVTPTWPSLQGILYESDYLAQFFLIFDSRRKLMGQGDAWPSATKLGKGRHVVRLQVKHPSVAALEALVDLPMHLARPLKARRRATCVCCPCTR